MRIICKRCERDRVHAARGLCSTCTNAAKADGTLIDYPRTQRRDTDTLADWLEAHDNGTLHPADPLVERCRQLAPRLGMTPKALERAVRRQGITNPVAA